MKIILILILIILLPIASFSQKKKDKSDVLDTMAMLKEFKAEMMKALIEDLKPSADLKPDRINDEAVPTNLTDAQIKSMTQTFLQSFYFRPSPFGKNELLVESDDFLYPQPDWVKNEIKYTKALDTKNKNQISTEAGKNMHALFSVKYNNNASVKLATESADQIKQVEADIKIIAPIQFSKISLAKNEINQSKKLDTMLVTLLKMDNDIAAIWIKGDYDNIRIYPFNATGMPLDVTSNTYTTMSGEEKELSSLKFPKNLGPGSLAYIRAYGKIDKIEVILATRFYEQTAKSILTSLPVFTNGKAKLDKERYQAFIPKDFSKRVTPEASWFDVQKQLTIDKVVNEWEKTTSYRINYQLPLDKIQSDYAQVEFKNVTMLVKGKPVKTYETHGYFDIKSKTCSFVPQDDEYKNLTYDQAKGEIVIRYPKAIKTVTIKRGEKKDGVYAMEGNKLVLNMSTLGEAAEAAGESELVSVRAYGKGNLPLKQDNYTSYSSANDLELSERYYWGTITKVEIDSPTEFVEFTLPFDIKKTESKTSPKKKK